MPRLLLSWLDDYASQRALWFSLTGLFVAARLWTVAAWLGGRAGLRVRLLAPAVWLSPPTQLVLQVGNVHAAVVVASMLALVAFETKHPAIGGALLAFAILSKLSPGLLVLVLLARRRLCEVIWTAVCGVGFSAIGLLVFGVAPFEAFLSYELPRLASGEALTFLADRESVPVNLAPFGVPLELALLGMYVGDPGRLPRSSGRCTPRPSSPSRCTPAVERGDPECSPRCGRPC